MFMKMERSRLIAFVVIMSTVRCSQEELLCPIKANPFWIQGVTVLRQIPQKYVACDLNHNSDLKKNIIVISSNALNPNELRTRERINGAYEHATYYLPQDCPKFYAEWFDSVYTTLLHNLGITMAMKLLKLFEDNAYQEFKQEIFKDKRITNLSGRTIARKIKKGREFLQNAVLPNLGDNPDIEEYKKDFDEVIRIYEDIRTWPTFLSDNCVSGCFQSAFGKRLFTKEECAPAMTDRLLRCSGKDQKTLENAIRFVRKYFGNNDNFELKLPMVPPCFTEKK